MFILKKGERKRWEERKGGGEVSVGLWLKCDILFLGGKRDFCRIFSDERCLCFIIFCISVFPAIKYST